MIQGQGLEYGSQFFRSQKRVYTESDWVRPTALFGVIASVGYQIGFDILSAQDADHTQSRDPGTQDNHRDRFPRRCRVCWHQFIPIDSEIRQLNLGIGRLSVLVQARAGL